MELALYASVKNLYDNELYGSVITTASLLRTLLANERATSNPDHEYHTTLFLANSYYHERQFRLAAEALSGALLLRKAFVRCKTTAFNAFEQAYNFGELEIKYRLAVCYRELGEHSRALSTLQLIPPKSRTPKVNMLIAKMLHYGSAPNTPNNAEAVISYKEVLKECPMALEAVSALLELGVDGFDVNAMVISASSIPKHIEWLSSWIKGHAQMYGRQHLQASKTFQSLNDTTNLRQNEHLLTLIGQCLYYYGSFAQAQRPLEMAVMLNPYHMEAVMPLAAIYEYNQKLADLEKLTSQYSNIHEFTSGHWFVIAQTLYANGKYEKAATFTHKAISMNPRNVEAQLLRGKICLQLKRHKEAVYFFRTAQCLANYRFEVYKGLFHCYIGLKRMKEAQTMCVLAVRYFRNSPRSYVMFARTLFNSTNPLAKKSAKKFVTRALEVDENYAPAVALMAEICQDEGEISEALAILKRHVVNFPHHKLYTILGEMLSSQKDFSGALEYYTIALSMEPSYNRALDGVNALGQASRLASDSTGNVPSVSATADAAKVDQPQDVSMTQNTSSVAAQDEEWPIDCDEPSMEAVELSSPAGEVGEVEDVGDNESDFFSDPFWTDAETEVNR